MTKMEIKHNLCSEEIMKLENTFCANTYHSIPVVWAAAKGIYVWDQEGRKYMDFLAAYSSVNQGHCHPKVISALTDQCQKMTISSRAFHSASLGPYAKFICNFFSYQKMIPMNTGVEAVETGMKLARKWGYLKKGIRPGKAAIVSFNNNFHGRTMAAISMSTEPKSRRHFGPFLPGVGSDRVEEKDYRCYSDHLKSKLQVENEFIYGLEKKSQTVCTGENFDLKSITSNNNNDDDGDYDDDNRFAGGKGSIVKQVEKECINNNNGEKSKDADEAQGINWNVPYDDLESLEAILSKHSDRIAAVMIEPIQGEAGVIVPKAGFLSSVASLCKRFQVLLIADEIQTGLGRTGALLACDHEAVRPDILLLGKALSAGTLPISAVLADDEIMSLMQPGEHGSTYGGNPLACEVAMAALTVLKEENLMQNACKMGNLLRSHLLALNHPIIETVRGVGLLNAIVVRAPRQEMHFSHSIGKGAMGMNPKLQDEITNSPGVEKDARELEDSLAWKLSLILKENGLLVKGTHANAIRLSPPLCINEDQIKEAVEIIKLSLDQLLCLL